MTDQPFTDTLFAPQDPLLVIEKVARESAMTAERVDAEELHVCLTGPWKDVSVWFSFREQLNVLQMGAPLELRIAEHQKADIARLIALVNERVWLGHFDLWSDDGSVVFRIGSVLSQMSDFDRTQAETLLKATSEAFEKFYPAFNYVIWGGRTPEEALEATLFETAGSA